MGGKHSRSSRPPPPDRVFEELPKLDDAEQEISGFQSKGLAAAKALPQLYDGPTPELSLTEQSPIVEPLSVRKNERPSLTFISGVEAGRVFPLDHVDTFIGRTPESTIQLAEGGISRKHSRITRTDLGTYLIEDLGSTNGTMLNGKRITRAELRPGDRVQLGPGVVFQFVMLDEAEGQLARTLYESSTRDALTGAFNRKYLQDHILSEVSFATRHRTALSFLLFDLDHFKKVNDSFGHPGGDAVLRGIADTVRKITRPEDIFTRYGGEEFALLARGVKIEDGVRFAERLRKSIESLRIVHEGRTIQTTVSVGVAELWECQTETENARPTPALSATSGGALLALADRRLYLAKTAGRNRVISVER